MLQPFEQPHGMLAKPCAQVPALWDPVLAQYVSSQTWCLLLCAVMHMMQCWLRRLHTCRLQWMHCIPQSWRSLVPTCRL